MDFGRYRDLVFEGPSPCLALVRRFYREQLGEEIPDYAGRTDADVAAAVAHGEENRWTALYAPETPPRIMLGTRPRLHRPGDVVLLNTYGLPIHVGIVAPDRNVRQCMLHVREDGTSEIEAFDGIVWKDRVIQFYRLKSNPEAASPSM